MDKFSQRQTSKFSNRTSVPAYRSHESKQFFFVAIIHCEWFHLKLRSILTRFTASVSSSLDASMFHFRITWNLEKNRKSIPPHVHSLPLLNHLKTVLKTFSSRLAFGWLNQSIVRSLFRHFCWMSSSSPLTIAEQTLSKQVDEWIPWEMLRCVKVLSMKLFEISVDESSQ